MFKSIIGQLSETCRKFLGNSMAGDQDYSAGWPNPYGLSHRQLQIFALLVRGDSVSAISRQLRIAQLTVKSHITKIYRRLGMTGCSRQELVAKGHEIRA